MQQGGIWGSDGAYREVIPCNLVDTHQNFAKLSRGIFTTEELSTLKMESEYFYENVILICQDVYRYKPLDFKLLKTALFKDPVRTAL